MPMWKDVFISAIKKIIICLLIVDMLCLLKKRFWKQRRCTTSRMPRKQLNGSTRTEVANLVYVKRSKMYSIGHPLHITRAQILDSTLLEGNFCSVRVFALIKPTLHFFYVINHREIENLVCNNYNEHCFDRWEICIWHSASYLNWHFVTVLYSMDTLFTTYTTDSIYPNSS